MPLFDLSRTELEAYRPDRAEPGDFDAFWVATLAATRAHPLAVETSPYALDLPLVDARHVWFSGFDGHRIHALWLAPSARAVPGGPPAVVQFLGYGDGTGSALDWLALPAAGLATLVVDTRGQGARARRAGRTGDLGGSHSPHVEGFLTRGILDPADYYYRRVYADAVRAVETAHTLTAPRAEGLDRAPVAVAGTSQGGGIALAAAALADDVAAAVVNVPFLCHMSRAIEVTARAPYAELLAFVRTQRPLASRALETLSYFDGVNLAARANVPALFSVALMDDVCPPSTVYAARNHYAGPSELDVYPWNEHEGGGADHDERTITWLRQHLADPDRFPADNLAAAAVTLSQETPR